jgi:S-DNA-T family DNA segregation ATPase FtsK/SpoIIIE
MDDVELHNVIQWLRDRAEPQFHPELMQMRAKNVGSLEDRDPMFDEAVRVVLESQRGSVSLLQRRLGVGYARASRLIEQMAAAGVVGDYKGSQAREVAMTLDEWEQFSQAQAAAEAASDDEDDDEPERGLSPE